MAGAKGNRRKAPTGCYWRGPVLWCRFTVNGREHRESLRTDDPTVAERRAKEIRSRHEAGRFGEQLVTWEQAVTAWGDHIAHVVKAPTAARYANSLAMVEAYFTGKDIKAIGKAEINAMVTGRAKAVSTATIRRDLTAVASVLSFAEDQDWREGNPALDKARRLKERRDPIVLPSEADIARVIALLPTQAHRDLATVARETGARLNELVTLERRQCRDGRILFNVTKRGRGRTIDASAAAWAAIQRQPAAIGNQRVFHVEGGGLGDVSGIWRNACAKAQKAAQKAQADFTPHRFHDLRHAFAVGYLKTGNIYDLQLILGHTSIKTTEVYLAYLTPDEAAAAKYGRTKDGTNAAVLSVTTEGNRLK